VETAELATALTELNRRRLRVMAPLMGVLHAVHVALFHVPAAQRAVASADWLRWRAGIQLSHAVMLPLVVVAVWLAWDRRRSALLRTFGPVIATAYLVHGALCSGFDQIVVATMTPFIGYCLGIAVILVLTPVQAIIGYSLAAATMVGMILVFQRVDNARLAALPNVFSVSVIGVALAWMQHAARRREIVQKQTIDRQSEELAALNASLERRVQEQVAQLQAKVVARSGELSLALGKLARQRESEMALAQGAVLADRFVVGEILGEGGMGAVYAGVDRTSGARVAIKVIQATSARQLDALRRFIREAGATAALTHPAVVRVIHVDVSDDGLLYQVLELVDGETLTRRMSRKWAPGEAARLGAVLADALGYAHAHGVVHRDVKPDNIMLTTAAPGLKLLDFGIAKLYDAVSQSEETTRGGLVLGTPAFMSPEQVGGGNVGDRTDVYAVGVILFRLLAARGPFEASSPQEMMMRQVMAIPPDLRTIDESLPPALTALVARCLAKEPSARPTAAALSAELAAFADAAEAPTMEKLAPPSKIDITVRARV
jgi:energy-converting hydrogenase Eha subunit C